MAGTSTLTKAVMVRLPNEVADKVERNAERQGRSVSDYLRRMIVLQVGRKR